jgi:hypothetical protein
MTSPPASEDAASRLCADQPQNERVPPAQRASRPSVSGAEHPRRHPGVGRPRRRYALGPRAVGGRGAPARLRTGYRDGDAGRAGEQRSATTSQVRCRSARPRAERKTPLNDPRAGQRGQNGKPQVGPRPYRAPRTPWRGTRNSATGIRLRGAPSQRPTATGLASTASRSARRSPLAEHLTAEDLQRQSASRADDSPGRGPRESGEGSLGTVPRPWHVARWRTGPSSPCAGRASDFATGPCELGELAHPAVPPS